MNERLIQRIDIYFFLFFTFITILVLHNPFFWDTTQLGSHHAFFYLENNLKLQFLPDEIDSGHIPSFGYLLAVMWKLFGVKLPIAHLMMLPFLIGLAYQARILIQRFFSSQNTIYVMLIFFLDPTILAQSTLITPDIPLLFFFILSINAILSAKNNLKLLAYIGLALISMRGWMALTLLFVFDTGHYILQSRLKHLKVHDLKILFPYIPAGIIITGYLLSHYLIKGWVGYHPGSPWAPCFEKVGFQGFIKNVFILGWRLADFGRIILWVFLLISVKRMFQLRGSDKRLNILYFLNLLFIVFFPLTMLLYRNLLGTRYLLPTIALFSIMVCYLVFEKSDLFKLRKKIFFSIILISLLLGNLLRYPSGIAQGWDSSLAYLPFFKVRNEMLQYLEKNSIKLSEIGTEFPVKADLKYTDLININERFANKDFHINEYFLYSNMINDLSDDEIHILRNQWKEVQSYSYFGIQLILYQSPDLMRVE